MSGVCRFKDALYRLATNADDALLRQLLRENGMPSWVTMATEREPSYFEGASLMGESYALIAEDSADGGEIIGMYAYSSLPVHINGKAERIGYLGGMRVTPAYRHKIRYIKQGFQSIQRLVPKRATVPYCFSSIASGNRRARRLLEANLRGMPRYTPRGEMSTLLFSVRQGDATEVLSAAAPGDIPEIVAFYNDVASEYQLSPRLSETWLRNLSGDRGLDISDFWLLRDGRGAIECCLALWDQRAFKQSVVKAYQPPVASLRRLYNLFARMTKRVELPEAGRNLEHLYIAFFAFRNDSAAVDALRQAARIAEAKGGSSCVLGLSSEHPFLQRVKRLFRASVYRTEIETVAQNDGTMGEPCFDGRMIQPEVALL